MVSEDNLAPTSLHNHSYLNEEICDFTVKKFNPLALFSLLVLNETLQNFKQRITKFCSELFPG